MVWKLSIWSGNFPYCRDNNSCIFWRICRKSNLRPPSGKFSCIKICHSESFDFLGLWITSNHNKMLIIISRYDDQVREQLSTSDNQSNGRILDLKTGTVRLHINENALNYDVALNGDYDDNSMMTMTIFVRLRWRRREVRARCACVWAAGGGSLPGSRSAWWWWWWLRWWWRWWWLGSGWWQWEGQRYAWIDDDEEEYEQ